MKLRKITAFGIMMLLVITIFAAAVSAIDLNPLHLFGGGGNKASSNLANKLIQTMTSKESADYAKEREQYWLSQGETPANAKKKAGEDLFKYKAEKVAKDISSKVGGVIGGAMTGVFTTIGGTMEGVIRSTPAKQTYDTIMDKIKYNTNLEYKVESVRTKNNIYWNRACDELEKLQPGYKCERPKGAAPVTAKGVVTGAKPKTTSKARSLMKKYAGK